MLGKEQEVWSVEASISVRGPKEGPVVLKIELPATTKENALAAQRRGLQAVIDANGG